MSAMKDVKQSRVRIQTIKSTLELRKENYDYNGVSIIDDALISIDQCIEALKILEENERERYTYLSSD